MALGRILVVGAEPRTQELVRPYARQLFSADHTDDLWDLIDSVEPHMILIDKNISSTEVCSLLQAAGKRSVSAPMVVVGDQYDEEHIKEMLSLGAFDHVRDISDLQSLAKIVDRLKNRDKCCGGDHETFFSSDCPPCISIVGKSHATAKALRMIRLVADSSCNPVLIVGETGTGKELAAKAVHVIRHGSQGAFVAVNCAALTANLLESELFGHVKGSFTSADREKKGLLEIAGSGSIFLDEVSEMPLDLQAKLLRVLQEKNFRKVGGTKDIECNATIITSSNRNLFEEVQKGKFRRDLYYRLSICPIYLAPLRDNMRRDDILLLAEYFIRSSDICPEKKGRIKGLTRLAAADLTKHTWPGNVRELKNVIDRAIMLEGSDRIGLSNLIINPDQYAGPSDAPGCEGLKDFSLERAEKELVGKALAEAGWQKTRAAALLGITRATLYAKVKQYNIKAPHESGAPVLVS